MKMTFFSLVALTGLLQSAPDAVSLVQAALQKVDPEIQADHYDMALADLNGDGKEEVFALMNQKSNYVGSGGATLFVLKATAEGYEAVGKIGVVNEPIYARKTSQNGFRDLLVSVRGGGATSGLVELNFDGKSYPRSPGEKKATEAVGDQLIFAEPTPPYEQKESLLGIEYQVSSPNTRSGNQVTVTPRGLTVDNTPQVLPVSGIVTRMELADLNVDGSPELYVYGFDGKSQTVMAWSANQKKSLSQISLPELDASHAKGYRGGDEFAVVEGILARRFPIYPEDAAEKKPTGRMRQIQYKLHAGEAGWQLKVDQVVEF